MTWRLRRDSNLALVTSGRFVRYKAYLPKYGVDAGMTCVIWGAVTNERVPCLFYNPERIVEIPWVDFVLSIAECLDATDLRKPAPRIRTFKEAFGCDPVIS